MRKSEIKIGDAYAVVGNQQYGYEQEAVRGVIAAPGSQPGTWLVRFAEPMVRGEWGRLLPAAGNETTSSFGKTVERTQFTELEIESRYVIAPWERHIERLNSAAAAEAAERERLQGERSRIEGLLKRLEQDIAQKGFDVAPPRLVLSSDFVRLNDVHASAGAWLRGRVLVDETILAYLVAAVEAAPARELEQTPSALGSLLKL